MALQATSALQGLTVVSIGLFRCRFMSLKPALVEIPEYIFSYEYLLFSPDEGSSAPQPCPAGTFSSAAGLVSKDKCQPCRAGFYCATVGLQTPTAPCREGENNCHCTKLRLVKCSLNNFYILSLSFFGRLLVPVWSDR